MFAPTTFPHDHPPSGEQIRSFQSRSKGFLCRRAIRKSQRLSPLKMQKIYKFIHSHSALCSPASVAQLDASSDWRPGGRGFNPRRGRQHSFVEMDHEIFSTVILSLPLIQEGQLSVSGERMCTILVNHLED